MHNGVVGGSFAVNQSRNDMTTLNAPTDVPTVRQALDHFYASHNFGEEGGINSNIAYIQFGPVQLPIPNTQQRKDAIWLHDLHHLLNGYDTTWPGEGKVSAWELATGGFGPKLYIWLLVLMAMSIGILLYPLGTFRAFVRGTYCRPILSLSLSKNELLQLPLNQLQRRIGIDVTRTYPVRVSHYARFGLLWLLYIGGLAALVGALWYLIG